MNRAIRTKKSKNPIRFPISLQLMLIAAAPLLLALPAIIVLTSWFINERRGTLDHTRTANMWIARAVEDELESVRAGAVSFLWKIEEVDETETTETDMDAAALRFFTLNPAIKAVCIPSAFIPTEPDPDQTPPAETDMADAPNIHDEREPRIFTNDTAVGREQAALWYEGQKEAFGRTPPGATVIRNAASYFDIPLLVMIVPYESGDAQRPVAVFFSPEAIMRSFGASASCMIDEAGGMLVQTDERAVDKAGNPLIRQLPESGNRSLTAVYTDDGGNEYGTAWYRLAFPQGGTEYDSGLAVVTTSKIVPAFENIVVWLCYVGGGALILALLLIWLYAKTISEPMKALMYAADSVEKGDYALHRTNRNRDEIGELTRSFIAMTHALEYGERFVDAAVLRLARQGKLVHAGKIAAATICIVKFRAFEKLTGALSARDTAALASTFFSYITPCIARAGGVIDRFLTNDGAAVAAFWGALESVSPERDAMGCIHAALMMRVRLQKLNQGRLLRADQDAIKPPLAGLLRGQAPHSEVQQPEETARSESPVPFLKMDCVINTGELLTGIITMDNHKEWLGLGDMVKLAEWGAEANEEYDTDIVIMEDTWKCIGERLVLEEMPVIEVQGRETPLRTFALVNVQGDEEANAILQEMETLPDMEAARLWLGVTGPQTMAGVRERWRINV